MRAPLSAWVALFALMMSPDSRAGPLPVEGFLSAAAYVGVSDGSSGSGFFWKREGRIYFVTARHLLFVTNSRPLEGSFKISSDRALLRSPVPSGTRVNLFALDLVKLQARQRIRFHFRHDIAVIDIGRTTTNGFDSPVVFSPGVQDVSANPRDTRLACAPNDIRQLKVLVAGTGCLLVGYATSLGREEDSGLGIQPFHPWARTGKIVSVNYHGGTVFVAGRVFNGDSGGPVFESDPGSSNSSPGRLIGVISQYVEMTPLGSCDGSDPAGACRDHGYIVVESADALLELLSAPNELTLL